MVEGGIFINQIIKYPRTMHLKGSKLQKGDYDLSTISFNEIKESYIVIEEKMDGSNCGISFDESGKMYLQSRGHFLNGGYGEKHFALFKTWANVHKSSLYNILGSRYIMYGEWIYAKHTVYYDDLTHYFMEFDIYDKDTKKFLSTKKRKEMLDGYDFIVSVLVLFDGYIRNFKDIEKLVTNSKFKTKDWTKNLEKTCNELNLSYDLAKSQTDSSDKMEGLYIKVENEEEVLIRCKYVRDTFTNTILDSETHWVNRPIIPNKLRFDIDIFKE